VRRHLSENRVAEITEAVSSNEGAAIARTQ
jgi:hypothetical protein